jgi:hypothetical protein
MQRKEEGSSMDKNHPRLIYSSQALAESRELLHHRGQIACKELEKE